MFRFWEHPRNKIILSKEPLVVFEHITERKVTNTDETRTDTGPFTRTTVRSTLWKGPLERLTS